MIIGVGGRGTLVKIFVLGDIQIDFGQIKLYLSEYLERGAFMSGRKNLDYHRMADKVVGKPTTRDSKDALTALHWLLDGNLAMLTRYDPYLWYVRLGVEKVLECADRERKKNL